MPCCFPLSGSLVVADLIPFPSRCSTREDTGLHKCDVITKRQWVHDLLLEGVGVSHGDNPAANDYLLATQTICAGQLNCYFIITNISYCTIGERHGQVVSTATTYSKGLA